MQYRRQPPPDHGSVSSNRDKPPEPSDLPAFPLGRGELIAAGFLIAGVILIVAAVVLTRGSSNDDPGDNTTATAVASPSPSATGAVFSPTDADGQAIVTLARKSIEVLPVGQWPSLYDDFVSSFQDRCSATEFAQAGIDSANNLGTNLALLGYKRMQGVTIAGNTADGIIVGELKGISEYQVEAHFAKENGTWKISPAPGTGGCSAFNVISQ